jgi:hypothetical protein
MVTQFERVADDDGQRHRAHRSERPTPASASSRYSSSRAPTSASPTRRSRRSRRPCSAICRPAPAAADPQLQRLDRSDHPARAVRQGPVRANAVRPRPQLRARSDRHRAGRGHAVSVRRQVPPGSDRLDPEAMQARGLSGQDVANALRRAEPDYAGRHREDRHFRIRDQPQQRALAITSLGDLPIKAVNGAMVYIRDVAHVRDGNPPQQPTSSTSRATAPC